MSFTTSGSFLCDFSIGAFGTLLRQSSRAPRRGFLHKGCFESADTTHTPKIWSCIGWHHFQSAGQRCRIIAEFLLARLSKEIEVVDYAKGLLSNVSTPKQSIVELNEGELRPEDQSDGSR